MAGVSRRCGRLCALRIGLGSARLGGDRFRPGALARADSLPRHALWNAGLATQASSEPAAGPTPAPNLDKCASSPPTPSSELSQRQSTGRHRLFEALENGLAGWLAPMVGLGAARSYEASGTVGLAAAAAERRASYRRARTFAKHASDPATPTSGRPNNEAPPRRRRKATSAWLDPLD